MRRRALLGSAAGVLSAGVAGCLTDAGSSGPATSTDADSTEPSATEEETTSTRLGVDLSVTLERHQPNVVVMAIDSIGLRPEGYQYLFYRVDVTDGEPPARTDFGFRYGGQVYSPGVDTGGTLHQQEPTDRYTAGRGEGWLVFELPAGRPAEHAALALGGEEWPVSEATRERLSTLEPSLAVDWGLTDEQPEDAARLEFSVTNEGDVDTRFVAALNGILLVGAHSPVTGFNREVPAGETVSWTHTHEETGPYVPSTKAESDSHYHLEWTQGDEDLYVTYPDAG